MHETAIRAVGGVVLVATLVLIGAVSYELVTLLRDPIVSVIAAVPFSESELALLATLLLGVLSLLAVFWLLGQSSGTSMYSGDEDD